MWATKPDSATHSGSMVCSARSSSDACDFNRSRGIRVSIIGERSSHAQRVDFPKQMRRCATRSLQRCDDKDGNDRDADQSARVVAKREHDRIVGHLSTMRNQPRTAQPHQQQQACRP